MVWTGTGTLAQFQSKHSSPALATVTAGAGDPTPSPSVGGQFPHATLWSSNPEFGGDVDDVVVAHGGPVAVPVPPLVASPVPPSGIRVPIVVSAPAVAAKKEQPLYGTTKEDRTPTGTDAVISAEWLVER